METKRITEEAKASLRKYFKDSQDIHHDVHARHEETVEEMKAKIKRDIEAQERHLKELHDMRHHLEHDAQGAFEAVFGKPLEDEKPHHLDAEEEEEELVELTGVQLKEMKEKKEHKMHRPHPDPKKFTDEAKASLRRYFKDCTDIHHEPETKHTLTQAQMKERISKDIEKEERRLEELRMMRHHLVHNAQDAFAAIFGDETPDAPGPVHHPDVKEEERLLDENAAEQLERMNADKEKKMKD